MQEDTEEEVCTFIHNLITNSYDEYGHIYLDNGLQGLFAPNDLTSMNTFQKCAMAISVLRVVGLLGYAGYLHRKITKSKFSWYPRGRRAYGQGGFPGQPANMERMHSGIIQGRSRSAAGPELQGGAVFA